ncbi:MAG: hypothetical protein IKM77_12015 [Prevotella sp.]|nr:hypothetical protein [Prevotella sp.]
MKRLLGFICLAMLLVSCSPQKRLAYLLEHHPELRTGESVRTIEVYVPVEAARQDTNAIPDVRVDTVTKTDTVALYIDKEAYDNLRKGVTVQKGKIKATVQLTDKGLQLSVEQEADTIQQNVDVDVPQYEIEVKKKAELSGWQKFCYEMGLSAFIILCIGLVVGIIFLIVKFAL